MRRPHKAIESCADDERPEKDTKKDFWPEWEIKQKGNKPS
mgnify:CR=1 FL=1